MFVTMFICRLDLKTLQLEYCNAGHNPPIISNADGQFSFLDVLPNAPIGLWPGLEYEGEEMELQSNQRLLLYTDDSTKPKTASRNSMEKTALSSCSPHCLPAVAATS